MLKMYTYILICFLAFSCFQNVVIAQKKSNKQSKPTATSHHRGRFKLINISHDKFEKLCPIFQKSGYPYHGVGFKIGDPVSFTYKFYATEHFNFAVDVGKSAESLLSEYYRNQFLNLTRPDTLNINKDGLKRDLGEAVNYLNHVVDKNFVIEAKFMYQGSLREIFDGLNWYLGAGAQYRNISLEYEYQLDISFDRSKIQKVDYAITTLGLTAAFGIEYVLNHFPIATFAELEFYTDIIHDLGESHIQGGLGIRYVF